MVVLTTMISVFNVYWGITSKEQLSIAQYSPWSSVPLFETLKFKAVFKLRKNKKTNVRLWQNVAYVNLPTPFHVRFKAILGRQIIEVLFDNKLHIHNVNNGITFKNMFWYQIQQRSSNRQIIQASHTVK